MFLSFNGYFNDLLPTEVAETSRQHIKPALVFANIIEPSSEIFCPRRAL